ncbi:hypothetical protein FD723_40930 (plasmid) [Nostoc sp. C052]|uniref:hypothetical protein n=1 Tax=Nostoc sp. C052 TaxID=2576902 RepID=UPI0015C37960|nr:hypothetical protein [Nostoc sp. C052]QLE46578.1 hypothetical protein FD723_40930 [Nostoc sp. C052]
MASKTTSVIQSQAQGKPMHQVATSLKNASKKTLPPGLFLWLLILLSLTIVAPSLVAITTSSCGEGSVSVKLWEFEYQLTKKGDCGSLTEQSHK